MTGFLDIVADKVVEKFGKDISRYTFVLPGKRAYLLLKEKITERIQEPCWEPEFTTLTALTSEASSLQQANDIVLLARLFNICRTTLGLEFFSDNFDSFISWGEILLNDFSGIDNNMIDADKLFCNISDLKIIDNQFRDDSIDSQIEETLKPHSNPKEAKYHKEFCKIWDKLFDIYTSYRSELLKEGIGYPGMICRKAAEDGIKNSKEYIFIGFNTFNRAEHRFIKKIKPVAVYWDGCSFFDDEKTNRALNPDGMAAASQKIGSEIEEIIDGEKLHHRKIEIVKCPTDVMQCKAVMKRLEKIEDIGYETAIVLSDDNLLPVMLQSIPKEIKEVNVTTGLPLSDSSVYIFYKVLESIIVNQKKGLFKRDDIHYFLLSPLFSKLWNKDDEIASFRKKMEENQAPYLSISEISNKELRKFFCDSSQKEFNVGKYLMDGISFFSELSDADDITEISIRMIKCIESLDVAVSRYGIELSPKLFLRMLGRNLSRSYTPYVTEAMTGLQVTGILETRCQDFKNVFILSASDDTLPKGSQLLSFIPMNLRSSMGLPTSGDFQRMSASYFYHLLMRAENVCILYNGNTSNSRTGEASRFIRQIEYLTPKGTEISHTTIVSRVQSDDSNAMDFHHSNKTKEIFSKCKISASMLCTYLNCHRKFALQYIYKIRPKDTATEQFKASDYGTAAHQALEIICKEKDGICYSKERARSLLDKFESEVMPIIEEYGFKYIHDRYPHKTGTPDMDRLEKMIIIWVKNVLEYDASDNPFGNFRTLSTEKEYDDGVIVLDDNKGEFKTTMKVDRLDRIGDLYRIVDYKSGRKDVMKFGKIENIEKLFQYNKDRKNKDPLFQTLFYGISFKGNKWIPAIYSMPRIGSEKYSPYPDGDSSPISEEFFTEYENRLKLLIEEISDPDPEIEFDACSEGQNGPCSFCDFRALCGR